ncbi:MAG TPA: RNA polymerase subunit sigma-24 [Elusimicrobia bacterium]|nr:MAG: hypothetical protein A2089_10760 [Elusimicrobia bacterium GWD2_63_28]HCC46968.1 RNA polymerase subunit sigma-24 [Elusimicrobiota bacterium]
MDFAAAYEAYFARIYSYIRCRAGGAAAAEDLAAEVFRKALENFAQYDPARGNLAQWLFGIARNEVNYYFRRAALLRFLPLDLFGDTLAKERAPEAPGGGADGLAAALRRLDERERDLIGLKFYSELNNREIAKVTGLSESNVGTVLYRCMAKLRKELAGEEYEK